MKAKKAFVIAKARGFRRLLARLPFRLAIAFAAEFNREAKLNGIAERAFVILRP